jgi:hypothetical protein
MSLLSDFFIADASRAPKYDGGEAFNDADKCQFKGLSPLQGAQFLAILRGQEYTIDMVSEFKLVTPEDAEDWTMAVPQDMIDALAKLKPDQVPGLAARFAAATAEELGWSPDDFIPILRGLSALARRAIDTGRTMYLWNCL